MKKLISILLAVAIIFSLGILTVHADDNNGPKVALDAFMVNGTGTNYNVMTATGDDVHITLIKGETLKALGWAYKIGTKLDRVYWQYFGFDSGSKFANEPERSCSNVYRSRNDVAQYFGFSESDYQWFEKSGFGLDGSYINLEGVSELEVGKYYMRLVAAFEDGETVVIKKKFVVEVIEGTPHEAPKVKVNGTAVEPDAIHGVEISTDDSGKLVVTTPATAGANDPWVSVPFDSVDLTGYESVTIVYSVEGAIYANNIYARDTEVNPGYSGEAGSWFPSENMTGNTSITLKFDECFPLLAGKKLTGLRIPGAATPGASLVIESITLNPVAGQNPQQGQQGQQNPQTADASLIVFVVAAAAIALVVLKKKVF